jgi:hypothetical protein
MQTLKHSLVNMYLQQILLSHIVTKKDVKPGPRNIQAAKEYPTPRNSYRFSRVNKTSCLL